MCGIERLNVVCFFDINAVLMTLRARWPNLTKQNWRRHEIKTNAQSLRLGMVDKLGEYWLEVGPTPPSLANL